MGGILRLSSILGRRWWGLHLSLCASVALWLDPLPLVGMGGHCPWYLFGMEVLLPYGFVSCFVGMLCILLRIPWSNDSCHSKLSSFVLFRSFHLGLGVLLQGDRVREAWWPFSFLLRSVGHSADRQEFLYWGRDVDKPTTDLWPLCDGYTDEVLLERLQQWCSPTADRVQKIKGFPPLVDLRWEEKRSEANRGKNVKATLCSLSILKKHRDWFSEA